MRAHSENTFRRDAAHIKECQLRVGISELLCSAKRVCGEVFQSIDRAENIFELHKLLELIYEPSVISG